MNMYVRFVSGREERFDVEFFGPTGAESRLKEFAKNPSLLLQTDKELIVIPATSIECITFALPASGGKSIDLPNVRKAKRLK
jgi:hypothetical protein